MNYCIFYFCVLLFVTIVAVKRKVNAFGLVILVLYTVIGGLSIYISQGERLTWYRIYMADIKLWPFFILLIAYAIFFAPFLKSKQELSPQKIVTTIDDRYKFLLIIYIICSILLIINYAATVIQIIRSGNLAGNYQYFVLGGGGEFHYYNFVFYIATQVSTYTSLLCLIMAFLYLRDKKHISLSVITMVLYFISNGMIALYVSARGMIFEYAMVFLGLFLFIFPDIQKKAKTVLVILGAVAASVFAPYLASVTISRFTSEGAADSILQYFGQPPLIFNGAVQLLEKFYYGKFSINYLFGQDLNLTEFGHKWVQGFYTFVGYFYIDWGIPGIFIIGLVTCFIMTRIVKKRTYNISDLYLIIAYYRFLIKGSLVIGSRYILDLVMHIVLYILIRVFIENNANKVHITIRGKRI